MDFSEKEIDEDEKRRLREILEMYLYHWKWFLVGIVFFIGFGFLYLRYSIPVYKSQATVLIKEEQKGSPSADISIIEDLGLINSSSNLENEIELFLSRRLLTRVIEELELQTIYKSIGDRTGFQYREFYKKRPVTLVIHDTLKTSFNKLYLRVRPISKSNFEYYTIVEGNEGELKKAKFGDELVCSIGKISIQLTPYFNMEKHVGKEFDLVHGGVDERLAIMRSRLTVEPVKKDASVLAITYKGPVKDKNEAIINELIKQHELDKINDKNEVALKTSKFIDDRMNHVSEDLSAIDIRKLKFKTANNLIDVETNANNTLQKDTDVEGRIVNVGIQLELAESVTVYMDDQGDNLGVLPSNLGFEDQSIADLIKSHNEIVMQRIKLMASSTVKNPVIRELDVQIKSLRNSLKASLENLKNTAQTELSMLRSKESIYETQLRNIPGFEKDYRDILREQQIKETLYLYLLEKREENEIALAANVTNSKVFDYAFSEVEPISPNSRIVYFGAIILAILFPAGFIYIWSVLDTKIKSPKDVERIGIPFLGTIPSSKSKDNIIAIKNPKSQLSEAFRMLRTNLSFVASEKKNQVIFVTSSIAGEGKTFVSLNLGHSMALSGKKVILVGLDLRAPKISNYLGISSRKGVSDILVNDDLKFEELMLKNVTVEGFDILMSGSVPPNPSELLVKEKLQDLFDQLRSKYDVVIVDTAPTGLVADTVSVGHLADSTVYVVRANKIDKRLLKLPKDLYRNKKLRNIGIVLNDVNLEKLANSYGYGYGYGYGNVEESSKAKKVLGLLKLRR